jgi:hypothetical protein
LTSATRPERHDRLRIEEQVVDTSVDDIDPLEALDGPGIDAVVVEYDQVAPLDQLDPQLLGQKGVLEIGGVEDPRGQHHDGRVARRRGDRRQQGGQPPDVGVDRFDAVVQEQLGKDVLGHHPVLEQVGHPRWDPQVVLEHVYRSIGVANEVAATDVGPDAARRIDADALAAEVRGSGDQLGGDHSGADRPLLVVDVVDEQVEGVEPLDEPGLDQVPLLGRHDPGDDVEGPRPVHPGTPLVDGEGDPDGPHLTIGRRLALGEGLGAEVGKAAPQGLRRRSGHSSGADQLVVEVAGIVGRPGHRFGAGPVIRRVRCLAAMNTPLTIHTPVIRRRWV